MEAVGTSETFQPDLLRLRDEFAYFCCKLNTSLSLWHHPDGSEAAMAPAQGVGPCPACTELESRPWPALEPSPLRQSQSPSLPEPLPSPATALPSPMQSSPMQAAFNAQEKYSEHADSGPQSNGGEHEGEWIDKLWDRAMPTAQSDGAVTKRRTEWAQLYIGASVPLPTFHRDVALAASVAGIGEWDPSRTRQGWFKSEIDQKRLAKFRTALFKILSTRRWVDKDLSKCTDEALAIFLTSAFYAKRYLKMRTAREAATKESNAPVRRSGNKSPATSKPPATSKSVEAPPPASPMPTAKVDAMEIDSDEEVLALMVPSSSRAVKPPSKPRRQVVTSTPMPTVPSALRAVLPSSSPSLLETLRAIAPSSGLEALAQHALSRGLVHTHVDGLSAVELEGILLFEVPENLRRIAQTFTRALVDSYNLPPRPELLDAATIQKILATGDPLTALGALHPALLEASVVTFCQAAESDWSALASPPTGLKERLDLLRRLEKRFKIRLTHAERVIFFYRLEAWNLSLLQVMEQG